jgi:Zn-dependent metalloprotease
MKSTLLVTILSILAAVSFGQAPLKVIENKPHGEYSPFFPSDDAPSLLCNSRHDDSFQFNTIHSVFPVKAEISSCKVASSGSLWITLRENQIWTARLDVSDIMAAIIPSSVSESDWDLKWIETSSSMDSRNIRHVRIEQTLAGHPIHGQELILHIENEVLRDLNGFAWTGHLPEKLPAPVPEDQAIQAAISYLISSGVKFKDKPDLEGLHHHEDEIKLVWLPQKGKLKLTYEIHIHPNMMDYWTMHVDAGSLEIIRSISQLCRLHPDQLYGNMPVKIHAEENKEYEPTTANLILDGPTTVTDVDLLGVNRIVNAYSVGSNFFMIDASRSSMFNAAQSVMPNEPLGVIWTIDGQNGSPQQDNFEVIHVSNSNNNWKDLEVSAHHNAGESFEYFRTKFNRNSLNGEGGNIISIINVADENGDGLDNAFWSGQAMFYGNGNTSFQALAKGLDVAGHEMSHGVIQNTANLEYIGQSGALNESFADVFGAMIDRDDWRMGEDVVLLNAFPSGALRDLSDPHNGGSSLNDRGWQPAHMNEFQNLPNTPDGDNGGVHVNSGIPNRAFFLFASSIGKEKAEQIYYKALRDYLVKSSQFIDMRLAVEKAAGDLHGANSAEVMAARAAFDGVGIGSGSGGDYEEDIETNTGDDFILATDGTDSDLYFVPPTNPNQFVKMDLPAPLSRPSFTDDGTAAVYVDQENNMILISFNWSGGTLSYQAFYLEDNPQGIWRNIAVSKDGSKIAYTTSELLNEIWVYDYDGGTNQLFTLYNPTTAEGINTGEVLFADAMEWDYSGEYLMYDALNRIETTFGDGIEYWDIAFVNLWDNASNVFADGLIGKLFTQLPENISVGNPSFSKNSPYIITFDFLETYLDEFGQLQEDYRVLAANIEQGIVNEIYHNTTVGYPSYSRLDDRILFTYDNFGQILLATIELQPGDKTLPVPQTDIILITGAQKGVWFSTGNRDFTATEDIKGEYTISIYPQPAAHELKISSHGKSTYDHYSICDLTGRIVSSGTMNDRQSISVSQLNPGGYFLQLKGDSGQTFVTRFIKQ